MATMIASIDTFFFHGPFIYLSIQPTVGAGGGGQCTHTYREKAPFISITLMKRLVFNCRLPDFFHFVHLFSIFILVRCTRFFPLSLAPQRTFRLNMCACECSE